MNLKKEKKIPKKKIVKTALSKNDKERFSTSRPYFFLFACIYITLACYISAFANDWTHWDDHIYVYQNALTQNLSVASLPHFFTTWQNGNYHPFAMLSLAFDYKLFGMNSTGFHIHSILLHLTNVALVFLFVQLLTKQVWTASLTALLFGIHPCHVESVAWISERKDLLYVLYYLAGLITYLKYIYSGRQTRFYVLTLVFFIFSCLSKGQAVTFPFALLLIDYYTGRFKIKDLRFKTKPQSTKPNGLNLTTYNLQLISLLPFFLIAFVFGIVAVRAQQSINAIMDIQHYSFVQHLVFAAFALSTYLYKVFLPVNISAYYPYPALINGHPEWFVYICVPLVLLIAGVTVYSMKQGRTIAFGLGFFLINMVLLLQIFPVGGALMADRYTYLSYIGLFFILGTGLQKIMDSSAPAYSKFKNPVLILVSAGVLLFGIKTYARNKIWKGDESLFSDMLKNHADIAIANNNLGLHYMVIGNNALAVTYFNECIRFNPEFENAYINRGNLYYNEGKYESAIADYDKAIKYGGSNNAMFNNYAYYLASKDEQLDKARELAEKALAADPSTGEFMDTYGLILYKKKNYAESKSWFEKALKNGMENNSDVLEHYGDVFYQTGDVNSAVQYWQKAKENGAKSEALEKKIENKKI